MASRPSSTLMSTSSLTVGVKIFVRKSMASDHSESQYYKAEVLAIRESPSLSYYVHYIDFNKRLDEWVESDRIDMGRIEAPPTGSGSKKSGSGHHAHSKSHLDKQGSSTGTPKKLIGQKRKSMAALTTLPTGPATPVAAGQSSASKLSLPFAASDCSINSDSESRPSVSDAGGSTPLPLAPETELGYRAAMESLRRGGSMTLRTEELSRVKNISMIEMGRHRVATWYFSPYPESIIREGDGMVKLCETCLEPFADASSLRRHRLKCTVLVPPGNEIYRSPSHAGIVSFFEIDGHKQKAYCRNLCLLSKLFLDHKTLYYDVDPFLFYILTVTDQFGAHLVGYFSKEKESADGYNLACILTLPQYQRKGFGKLLIAFSYELSRAENKPGSPEKPLSDLGLLSYRSYWSEVLLKILLERKGDISISELSLLSCITPDDILHTLQALDVLKYYKGQHVILLTDKVVEDFQKSCAKHSKTSIAVDSRLLVWTPPQFTANQLKYI